MVAEAQYCMSGDFTLEASDQAIDEVLKKDGDEYFVIVLSDANLERYGIHPSELRNVLVKNENVQAYAIFLGSLGDQAERLKVGLGVGRGFVCLNTKDLD